MQFKNKKYVKIGCDEHPETVIEYEFEHGQEAWVIWDVYRISYLKFSFKLISEKQMNSMLKEIHEKIHFSLNDVNYSNNSSYVVTSINNFFTRKMQLTHPVNWLNITL